VYWLKGMRPGDEKNRHPEVPGSEMAQASVKPRPLA